MSLHRFTCGTDPLSVSSVWHSPWICFCCCWKSAGSRFKALLSLSLVVLEERPWPPRSVDLVQGCLLPSFVVRPEIQYKFPVRKLPLAKHFRNMTNFWKNQKNFSSNSKPWPRRRRPCPRLSVSLQNRERGESRQPPDLSLTLTLIYRKTRPDMNQMKALTLIWWPRWRPQCSLTVCKTARRERERASSVQSRALAVLDLC